MKQYDNINNELLRLIPHTASNVLELGCSAGRLAEVFKSINPNTKWTGVDVSSKSLSTSIRRMDEVVLMDLNRPRKEDLPASNYDTLIMGDVLEHLTNPLDAMKFAYDVSTPDAQVFCCMPIMTNIGVIERMLIGDLSYDEYGLLDSTHLRFMSIASTMKLFLDAGWLPNIVSTRYCGIGNGEEQDYKFTEQLIQAAATRGIPRSTAERNLLSFQIYIHAVKSPKAETKPTSSFSVIVPVDNSTIYEVNIGHSPGLKEVNAEIIPIYNSKNAAEAFAEGCKLATNKWVLYCKQDTYIPAGSGYMLAELFDTYKKNTMFGFAGTTSDGPAGLMIDRTTKFDAPVGTGFVQSIDEFAIALSTDFELSIDSAFGWDLWATDLCLQAANLHSLNIHICKIPMYRNSVTENVATQEFYDSLNVLKAKYKGYGILNSLKGQFDL